LTVRGLEGHGLHGVDLDVRAGEIVGVSGLLGSGAERLLASIFGAEPRTAGHVIIDEREVPPHRPRSSIAHGLGFVPADRHRHGAVLTMNARENLTLPRIDLGAENADVSKWFAATQVRPAHPERTFALFSGGNQQKIVLAKWLRLSPAVLLLEEPTQGVDVGARAAIHELITDASANGVAMLIVSSDAEELATLCDRVLIMHNGRIDSELNRATSSEAAIVRATLDSPATGTDAA
jgi:ribose transport system ATP-binding protein